MSEDTIEPTAEQTLWRSIEAIHAAVYFHPGAAAAYKEIGLRGYWSGYFASRSAALGRPSAGVVSAVFHGFAPHMVKRAIPSAWDLAEPALVLETRTRLAAEILTEAMGEDTVGDIAAAAEELQGVVADLDLAGTPLAAAHADVEAPTEPLELLWHADTVLREFRGDLHVAVLTASGIGGAEANVLQVALDAAPLMQQKSRGWSDEAWLEATHGLTRRGWLGDDGQPTDLGREQRAEIEALTDDLSRRAVTGLLGTATAETMVGIGAAVRESAAIPYPNGTGVAKP